MNKNGKEQAVWTQTMKAEEVITEGRQRYNDRRGNFAGRRADKAKGGGNYK